MGEPKAIMANTMDAPVAACERDQPKSSCHIGNIMLTDDRAPNVNAIVTKQIATTIQPRFLFAVSKSITKLNQPFASAVGRTAKDQEEHQNRGRQKSNGYGIFDDLGPVSTHK